MTRPPFVLLAVAITLICTGCGIIPGLHVSEVGQEVKRAQRVSPNEEILYFSQENSPIVALRVVNVTPETLVDTVAAAEHHTTDALPPLPSELAALDYLIGPGDVINIIVWDHPELTNPTGEFRDAVSAGRLVDAQGMMYYPYVGNFKAAGMNVSQLRAFIAQNLAAVVSKPQVDARVVAFRSQRVQVSGAVNAPGLVSLDDTPVGLIEAIGNRGGLTENASRRRVELTRGGKRYEVDLAALLSGSKAASNPILMAGDRIHVPDRSADQVFVFGEVNREGPAYLQQQRTTLTEVLAAAGGLNRTGSDDSGILVFRRPTKEGVATLYRAPLSSMVGLLTAGEFTLEPRDVIYVGSTAFAEYNSVINQLLPTVSAIFQIDALTRR